MALHVPSFGGGVVRVGSPDAQRTDELLQADGLDIGPRGQLVCTSDPTDYADLLDSQAVAARWSELYVLENIVLGQTPYIFAIGKGKDAGAVDRYLAAINLREGGGSVIGTQMTAVAPSANRTQVTVVQFPGLQTTGMLGNLPDGVLICLGAREGFLPNTTPGLFFASDQVPLTLVYQPISDFDALGTGPSGELAGTHAKQLYFRGIIGYNDHVFGWGYDSASTAGLGFDGPNRVMFCNLGRPLKWGNDNVAAVGADRVFTDSDAIVLGDAGEIIRGALVWKGRLYFGTNQQLHYIAGYGRDSYVTDGANPVAKSFGIVGPHAIIEGPDKLMYGVSDRGLWVFDGTTIEPIGERLIDFHGHSNGYWDLIWTDPNRFPSNKSNQDLVWMAVDWETKQVIVGIPFCDATAGYGFGADTVVLKWHPRTGGFTRQVFPGIAYTAAAYLRRLGQAREIRFWGTETAGQTSLKRFRYQLTSASSPVLPARLPVVEFGPYAPFGPDGQGVVRRGYLTLAWEAAASLPIVFTIATTLDGAAGDSYTLTIGPAAPGAPAVGDVWVDTSQTDANLGNATAGALLPATGGFLEKTWSGSLWRPVPGMGQKGTRATIILPLTRRSAARLTIVATCTSAAGRFQVEAIGINPGGGTDNA